MSEGNQTSPQEPVNTARPDASDQATVAAGPEAKDDGELTVSEARDVAARSWTRLGPVRFPPWTSTALLISIPASLLVTAIAGKIGGERTALVTLTGVLFGVF